MCSWLKVWAKWDIPMGYSQLLRWLYQAMIKPALQMAIAPKIIPMFPIDRLTTFPEFVLELVDCAPGLADEEPGNAGLVTLGVLLSPEEDGKLVDDGSELVPDAEALAGRLFAELAGPSTDAALSQKLYAGMFVSAAGSAKQEVLTR